MKQLTIAGRIGKDAEIRSTRDGTQVCGFTVAVSGRKKDDPATWFSVSIFGKRGEALAQYLRKGTAVTIVGDLTARTFEGRDGQTRIDLGVVASEVTLLGGGQRDEQRDAEGRSGGSYDRPPPRAGDGVADDDFDPDIPF